MRYLLGVTETTKQEYIQHLIEAYEGGAADLKSLNKWNKDLGLKIVGRNGKVKEIIEIAA